MITDDKITNFFCIADDFCKFLGFFIVKSFTIILIECIYALNQLASTKIQFF